MRDNMILVAKGVCKSFGGVKALNNVTLTVEKETLTLLIGPNGSGKSTFIQIVSGVLAPDSGALLFENRDITHQPPHRRFDLGIASTFQVPRLFPSLSVLENVLLAARRTNGLLNSLRRDDGDVIEMAFEVLSSLSLDRLWDKPASTLSGGQMKLLELARALASRPKLLLLDEPLAGVNPALASQIVEHLSKTSKEMGVTVLMVEHRLDIALRQADYVYAMHNGRVIAWGAPDEVIAHPEVAKAYLGG